MLPVYRALQFTNKAFKDQGSLYAGNMEIEVWKIRKWRLNGYIQNNAYKNLNEQMHEPMCVQQEKPHVIISTFQVYTKNHSSFKTR